jgi:hypothetical protein
VLGAAESMRSHAIAAFRGLLAAAAFLGLVAAAAFLGLLVAAAALAAEPRADVLRVVAQGKPGAYTLAVTVKSPDRSCDQYADWWEVVSPDGRLLFRRVLMHSHPEEQPFTRPGGPVPISAEQTVIVRAHLHPTGYGGAALRGSVAKGFETWSEAPPDFAAGLAREKPLPTECWR